MPKNTEPKKPSSAKATDSAPKLSSEGAHTQPKRNNWRIDRFFWGLLLVLVGILSLADTFGLIDVRWSNVWRLWPVVVIAAGLSVLSLQNRFLKVLSFVLVFTTLAVVVFVVLGDYSDKSASGLYETTIQKSSNTVKQATVTIQAGASALRVTTANQGSVATVKLQSDLAKLVHSTTTEGTIQNLKFSMDGTNRWWGGDVRSVWDVTLTRELPLQVKIDTGASDTDVDLSLAQLQSLVVKAGASSLDLKVGNRQDNADVTIDSGVSSVVLRVPNGTGVRLVLDGGLTTKRLADLAKTSDNEYESAGYQAATKKITVNAKIGVATFAVERY